MYSISFEILCRKYENREYRIRHVALQCACYVAYDTCRCDMRYHVALVYVFLFKCACFYIPTLLHIACSMLHWCKTPLMRIFGSVQSQSESTFLFLNITIFPKVAIFQNITQNFFRMYSISFEILFRKYENREYRIWHVALQCACHIAYDTCRCDMRYHVALVYAFLFKYACFYIIRHYCISHIRCCM